MFAYFLLMFCVGCAFTHRSLYLFNRQLPLQEGSRASSLNVRLCLEERCAFDFLKDISLLGGFQKAEGVFRKWFRKQGTLLGEKAH
mmetsp:Transcript_35592/g.98198  ORF Transcript_35592/g.98198 Transcript_35592/m.98198 type:complete len:86 (-) Transcript_35592:18-275(-)